MQSNPTTLVAISAREIMPEVKVFNFTTVQKEQSKRKEGNHATS